MSDWDTQFLNKRVMIELTDHCNLNCFMCCNRASPHGVKQGFMDFDLYRRILDEVDLSKGWSLELFWLGESMLHPQIADILKLTKEKVKGTNSHVNLHTNGLILDKEKRNLILDFKQKFPWLTFSVDALNEETYKNIRGGNPALVFENIRALVLERSQQGLKFPNLNIQFIIMEQNAKEARQFFEHWHKFYSENDIKSEDNIFFKRIEVHDLEKQRLANKLYDEVIEKFDLFEQRDQHLGIVSKKRETKPAYWFEEKKTQRRICAAPFKNPVIRWDGEMTVCCFDDIFLYSLGNLNKHSFKELWYSKEMDEFRRKHINGKYDELLTSDGHPKCKNCIGYYWPRISDEEIAYFKNSIVDP